MTGRTKEAIGWFLGGVGLLFLALAAAAWVNGCGLPPATYTQAGAIAVNAACQEVELLDPALAQSGWVELLCPQLPAPAPEAAPPPVTMTVNLVRVRTTRAAWLAARSGASMTVAPSTSTQPDAGGGG